MLKSSKINMEIEISTVQTNNSTTKTNIDENKLDISPPAYISPRPTCSSSPFSNKFKHNPYASIYVTQI